MGVFAAAGSGAICITYRECGPISNDDLLLIQQRIHAIMARLSFSSIEEIEPFLQALKAQDLNYYKLEEIQTFLKLFPYIYDSASIDSIFKKVKEELDFYIASLSLIQENLDCAVLLLREYRISLDSLIRLSLPVLQALVAHKSHFISRAIGDADPLQTENIPFSLFLRWGLSLNQIEEIGMANEGMLATLFHPSAVEAISLSLNYGLHQRPGALPFIAKNWAAWMNAVTSFYDTLPQKTTRIPSEMIQRISSFKRRQEVIETASFFEPFLDQEGDLIVALANGESGSLEARLFQCPQALIDALSQGGTMESIRNEVLEVEATLSRPHFSIAMRAMASTPEKKDRCIAFFFANKKVLQAFEFSLIYQLHKWPDLTRIELREEWLINTVLFFYQNLKKTDTTIPVEEILSVRDPSRRREIFQHLSLMEALREKGVNIVKLVNAAEGSTEFRLYLASYTVLKYLNAGYTFEAIVEKLQGIAIQFQDPLFTPVREKIGTDLSNKEHWIVYFFESERAFNALRFSLRFGLHDIPSFEDRDAAASWIVREVIPFYYRFKDNTAGIKPSDIRRFPRPAQRRFYMEKQSFFKENALKLKISLDYSNEKTGSTQARLFYAIEGPASLFRYSQLAAIEEKIKEVESALIASPLSEMLAQMVTTEEDKDRCIGLFLTFDGILEALMFSFFYKLHVLPRFKIFADLERWLSEVYNFYSELDIRTASTHPSIRIPQALFHSIPSYPKRQHIMKNARAFEGLMDKGVDIASLALANEVSFKGALFFAPRELLELIQMGMDLAIIQVKWEEMGLFLEKTPLVATAFSIAGQAPLVANPRSILQSIIFLEKTGLTLSHIAKHQRAFSQVNNAILALYHLLHSNRVTWEELDSLKEEDLMLVLKYYDGMIILLGKGIPWHCLLSLEGRVSVGAYGLKEFMLSKAQNILALLELGITWEAVLRLAQMENGAVFILYSHLLIYCVQLDQVARKVSSDKAKEEAVCFLNALLVLPPEQKEIFFKHYKVILKFIRAKVPFYCATALFSAERKKASRSDVEMEAFLRDELKRISGLPEERKSAVIRELSASIL